MARAALIREAGTGWELHDGDLVLATFPTYAEAVRQLAADLDDDPDAGEPGGDGLLAESWVSDAGIAFNEQPEPQRDFTNASWTWRDPNESLLPLMLQTETEQGHFGAVLAGYITQLSAGDGAVAAAGRFYDTDDGREARDLLLGGRRFGVSVDGGANTEAEVECTAEDDDGFCMDVVARFGQFEIIGLTMTPFPAFARAAIVLGDPAATDDDEPTEAEVADDDAALAVLAGAITAAGARDAARVADLRARPPAYWLTMPEPELGDPLLIQQDDTGNRWGVPFTVTDDGHAFGHLALWGECLRISPTQANLCLEPPDSPSAYAEFHKSGAVLADDGVTYPTGCLVVGCDHYPVSPWEADRSTHGAVRDWYAAAGFGFADLRASSGAFGVWVTGRVRPDVNDLQLSIARALSPSGDWNPEGEKGFELCAALLVNRPGYPVARERPMLTPALVAAAGMDPSVMTPTRPRVYVRGDRVLAMTGVGMVRACAKCREAELAGRAGRRPTADGEVLRRAVRLLETLEVRTRHLTPAARQAAITRLRDAAGVSSRQEPGTTSA